MICLCIGVTSLQSAFREKLSSLLDKNARTYTQEEGEDTDTDTADDDAADTGKTKRTE